MRTNFVPMERVDEFQANVPAPLQSDALDWVGLHLAELQTRYGGRWIAVANEEVVASADDLPGLMAALEGIGVDSPFVTQIPDQPIAWDTLYGNPIF